MRNYFLDDPFFCPPGFDNDVYALCRSFINEMNKIENKSLDAFKISMCINLFYWHLNFFKTDQDPMPPFKKIITACIESIKNLNYEKWTFFDENSFSVNKKKVEEIYSSSWILFDKKTFFNDTFVRLKDRFILNNIDPYLFFKNKNVLDCGAGCGNYAASIAKFGAKKVFGIDIGEEGIYFGRKMIKNTEYKNIVELSVASAIDVPFKNNSMDLVFSNSVIHVTGNYEKGISEISRVLKSGGKAFIYVDGKFGLFELLINTLRSCLTNVDQSLVIHLLENIGVNPGRISWIIANLFVPYERRPRSTVEKLFKINNLYIENKLERGIEIDQIEAIYQKRPFSDIKYGEAQLKYIVVKEI